jgi:hypothetical protein
LLLPFCSAIQNSVLFYRTAIGSNRWIADSNALEGTLKEKPYRDASQLRKCVPDLAAAEIKSEQTHRYVVEIPAVLTREQWLEKYGKCDKGSDLPDKPDRPLH